MGDFRYTPPKRHGIQKQLNRVEGRHNLAKEVFHGKRGELRKKYREGQEDQLGSLGLMLNIIVYPTFRTIL